jgi:hypothetical protein
MIGSWINTFFYSWYVMFPLLLCSIASLAIILERIISAASPSSSPPWPARSTNSATAARPR